VLRAMTGDLSYAQNARILPPPIGGDEV
jgi:hypothetical protein